MEDEIVAHIVFTFSWHSIEVCDMANANIKVLFHFLENHLQSEADT